MAAEEKGDIRCIPPEKIEVQELSSQLSWVGAGV